MYSKWLHVAGHSGQARADGWRVAVEEIAMEVNQQLRSALESALLLLGEQVRHAPHLGYWTYKHMTMCTDTMS